MNHLYSLHNQDMLEEMEYLLELLFYTRNSRIISKVYKYILISLCNIRDAFIAINEVKWMSFILHIDFYSYFFIKHKGSQLTCLEFIEDFDSFCRFARIY